MIVSEIRKQDVVRPTGSSEHLSIWTETAVKDSGLMCWNLNVAHQSRVAPDAEGVIGEAAGADDLTVVRAPSQAGNLRAGIDAVHSSTSCGIPEVNVTVIGSSTSSENVWLPWTPAESLDGGFMIGLRELGDSQRASIPNGDKVIISTSSKLSTICAPFKTTNFRGVGDQLGDLVLSNADIMIEDEA